ncbi:MAG: helicase-exonuclease AddAB subunit AddA [Lachnospiraceae bacterium]|nr:helicase-exonuclease AddAB subunit AddA [Lachnospiraceae bacterium]
MAKWTDAQQKVIDARDRNILVSAAAGSGKTAVLVERIIKRILDKDNPIDIDKILVVTFTNAAASEMRERILMAIDKELENEPDNAHLQKQQTYIHNAKITTIHSFCLDLIKEHFNEIDLDPAVRVAESTEIELLKSDVVKEVLEEFYLSGDEDFFRFVRQFENKRGDESIENMILDLYGETINFPFPNVWFDEIIAKYDFESKEQFEKSIYMDFVLNHTKELLKEIVNSYKYIIDKSNEDGLDKYVNKFSEELNYIESAMSKETFDTIRTSLNFDFGRMPTEKNVDAGLKEIIKKTRDGCKDKIGKIKSRFFKGTLSESFEEMIKCKKTIETYIKITIAFMDKFAKKKKDKNIIDFNDFEHYAINLLIENDGREVKTTRIADELSNNFEEVMIDEYQDSNLVQEIILRSVSKEKFGVCNRFMVGDVKQSIYGFRGSNPKIFVEKYNTYELGENASNYKIILDKNFRSRNGVIETTNKIFEQLMSKEFGGIDYDDENKLYQGAIYTECEDENLFSRIDDKSELILIDTREEAEQNDLSSDNSFDSENDEENAIKEDDEDLSATDSEAEAKVIAKRIKELTDEKNGMVICDKKTGEYRTVTYSDITILMRSLGKNVDVMQEEFTKQGIPLFVESRSGYFETPEIRTIINYLKIIDNPIQDIPLASSLKAVFGGFTDDEIANIRVCTDRKVSLYESLQMYLNEGDKIKEFCKENKLVYKEDLVGKIDAFFNTLNEFRDKSMYLSIYELISNIIEKTNYNNYILAMPSGKVRLANVEMLKQKAADYETGSYKGLFNFVRYIEKMNKYNIDMGEASLISENDNTVKVMSIHKSKGLEFPVVFIANVKKKFNFMDASKKAVILDDMGVGIEYFDDDTRIVSKSFAKEAISEKIRLNVIEEELRIFYVACTRARDKLIFTTSGKSLEDFEKVSVAIEEDREYLGYGNVCNIKSYFDILAMTLRNNKNILANVDIREMTLNQIFENEIKERYLEDVSAKSLETIKTEYVYDEKVKKILDERLSFEYSYKKEIYTPAKMSVSDIKKISYDIENKDGLEEQKELSFDFMEFYEKTLEMSNTSMENVNQDENSVKITGAMRGTIYHLIFELFDYRMEANEENIIAFLDDLQSKGKISETERSCIDVNDFVCFAKTELYTRMKNAYDRGELFREAQFVVGFADSEIEEYKRVAKLIGEENTVIRPNDVEKTGDTVLIQGIIDAYFIEDEKVVILDYKTDRIKEEQELVKHYVLQLEMYKKAVEQILRKEVKETVIYSVELGKSIEV